MTINKDWLKYKTAIRESYEAAKDVVEDLITWVKIQDKLYVGG